MVIFTRSLDQEIDEILHIAPLATRRFYVFSQAAAGDIDYLRMALPEFEFVALERSFEPSVSSRLFTKNSDRDLFVIKKPRLASVPDRNIGVYQMRLAGIKMVVDDHPFLGKAEVWWSYFLWSFIDKRLMGYPHSYAFRDANPPAGVDPYDPRMLARKVAVATRTHLNCVYPTPLEIVRVALTPAEHAAYGALREALFEAEDATPLRVLKGLRQFVMKTESFLVATGKLAGFDLLNLNRFAAQYQAGERRVVVSDAKVDLYLMGRVQEHFERANAFLEELANLQGGIDG